MVLVTSNKTKQLLCLSYIGRVRVEELRHEYDNAVPLLADLKPGFRILADLGRLDSMEVGSSTEIGRMMELCDKHGVELSVRVIPDPSKDIGLNILSVFHYRREVRTVSCVTMEEAAKILGL